MSRTVLVLLVLSLFLVSCRDGRSQETPPSTAKAPPSEATATSQARLPATAVMESNTQHSGQTNYWVYFVAYQTTGEVLAGTWSTAEWDCYPPDPDHAYAFWSVPVFHESATLTYDGKTLRVVGSDSHDVLVGVIHADGTWSMLEPDSSLHYTFKRATDTPEFFVHKYQDKPCMHPPSE